MSPRGCFMLGTFGRGGGGGVHAENTTVLISLCSTQKRGGNKHIRLAARKVLELLVVPLPHSLSRSVVETPRRPSQKEMLVFVYLLYCIHFSSLEFVD